MIHATLHTRNGASAITSATWRDEILAKGYTAFVFDCDGTLVESADVHFASFLEAAKEQGCDLDRDWYLARTALDRLTLFREFAADPENDFDVDVAVGRSISIFIGMSDCVSSIVETASLVRDLSRGFPLAVGTNAEKEVAKASLRASDLLDCFDHIVAISDGLKPKPSPEIFAKAADLLGQPLEQTLVIEDSKLGVIAAKKAGMDVIEITGITGTTLA